MAWHYSFLSQVSQAKRVAQYYGMMATPCSLRASGKMGIRRLRTIPLYNFLMLLTPEEVDHIALLARLQLSPEEKAREARELTQILNYFEKLGELDTEDVPPTSHVFPVTNVLREDVARPGLSTDAALQNAPEAAADMFQVPRVVEAE